eukprot:3354734-Heterocapsa_arctica.AAC.1
MVIGVAIELEEGEGAKELEVGQVELGALVRLITLDVTSTRPWAAQEQSSWELNQPLAGG